MLAIMMARAGSSVRRLIAMMLPLLAILGTDFAVAQNTLKGGPTPSAPGAEVYFVGLKDGATVATKFSVNFGLDRMGVAPAGSDRKDSGHHHLLIDTELPPLDQPVPNDFNHLHFGSGQTETTLTLRPGEHTLQLLLADKDHIPHSPPVMSARIKIRVVSDTSPAASAPLPAPAPSAARGLTPSAPGAEVYFVELQDGASVQRRFQVRFGLRNMGIAPAGSDRENSGHHHLLIDTDVPPLDQPIPNDFNHLHFGSGQTEATVTLAPGEHTLQLLLADGDHIPHNPPVMSPRIRVRVVENVATPAPNTTSVAPPAPPPDPAPGATSAAPPGPAHDHAAVPAPGTEAVATPPPASGAGEAPSSGVSPPTAGRVVERKPAPRGAAAYFVGRRNGDRVPTTVTLSFAAHNMDIRPSRSPSRYSGHYHLLIDSNLPPLDQPLPQDSSHLDFADGQVQAQITLTPGEHTLQLLLTDENHVAHDPPVMSAPLKLFVAEPRNRDDRNREGSSRRESSQGGPSQNSSSQSGPSQFGTPQNGSSQNGSWQNNRPQFGPQNSFQPGPSQNGRSQLDAWQNGRSRSGPSQSRNPNPGPPQNNFQSGSPQNNFPSDSSQGGRSQFGPSRNLPSQFDTSQRGNFRNGYRSRYDRYRYNPYRRYYRYRYRYYRD